LLRDSTTRRLVVLGGHDLHVPEYLFDEIETHRDELARRSGQTADALEEGLRILRGHVAEHEEADYVDELGKAGSLLGGRDPKDTPYVALALALPADGIWTEDRALISFVKKVSEIAHGRAYFTTPMTLGKYVTMDFMTRKVDVLN